MPHDFDPGYGAEPFRTLCQDYPEADVYPSKQFRVEWGPIFHRGRLDGSARVLVIGQDPAQHESVVRRILVGEAGWRIQGFLAKLGIDASYQPGDRVPIPEVDYPAGLPTWMREQDGWATRVGADPLKKRRNLTVTVPKDSVPS